MSVANPTSNGGSLNPFTEETSTASSTPSTAAASAAPDASTVGVSPLAQLLAQTRSPEMTTAAPVGAGQVVLGVLESLPGPAGLGSVRVDRIGRLPLIHSVVPLSPDHVGQRLALTMVDGGGLLALGVLWTGDAAQAESAASGAGLSTVNVSPAHADSDADALSITIDGQREVLQGARELELRCGEACILMTADGRIQLRGTYITSHASATQRIVGGSVHVN